MFCAAPVAGDETSPKYGVDTDAGTLPRVKLMVMLRTFAFMTERVDAAPVVPARRQLTRFRRVAGASDVVPFSATGDFCASRQCRAAWLQRSAPQATVYTSRDMHSGFAVRQRTSLPSAARRSHAQCGHATGCQRFRSRSEALTLLSAAFLLVFPAVE